MRDADIADFSALLDAVCGLLSRDTYSPSATNTALWFRALREYPLASVRSGFDAHVRDPQRGRFVPTPADIISHMAVPAESDGRPGPEEAWAIALQSRSEADTVVWTEEAAQAWDIARHVFALGDEVGARMAFREAYVRIVAEARRNRLPVEWHASLGFDAERRATAITAAVEAGRLPRADLLALPPPTRQELGGMPEAVRERLLSVAERLRSQPEDESIDQLEVERTRVLQAESQRKVNDYLGCK